VGAAHGKIGVTLGFNKFFPLVFYWIIKTKACGGDGRVSIAHWHAMARPHYSD
jgi:hypothetical protein